MKWCLLYPFFSINKLQPQPNILNKLFLITWIAKSLHYILSSTRISSKIIYYAIKIYLVAINLTKVLGSRFTKSGLLDTIKLNNACAKNIRNDQGIIIHYQTYFMLALHNAIVFLSLSVLTELWITHIVVVVVVIVVVVVVVIVVVVAVVVNVSVVVIVVFATKATTMATVKEKCFGRSLTDPRKKRGQIIFFFTLTSIFFPLKAKVFIVHHRWNESLALKNLTDAWN